jgi:hypothetical protein
MTRFVLLATQRSGSSWVRQMLNSHPDVVADDELFVKASAPRIAEGRAGPEFWALRWKEQGRGLRCLMRPPQVFRHLDEYFEERAGRCRATGFKLMYDQALLYPEIPLYLARRGVSVVHLIRQNFLDILLSKRGTALRGVYHSAETVEPVRIALDPSKLVRALSWQERSVRWATAVTSTLRLRCITAHYADLVGEPRRFEDVFSFLGVPRPDAPLSSALRKLNRAPHRELIENYEEIRSVLDGTRFASLLDDRVV